VNIVFCWKEIDNEATHDIVNYIYEQNSGYGYKRMMLMLVSRTRIWWRAA